MSRGGRAPDPVYSDMSVAGGPCVRAFLFSAAVRWQGWSPIQELVESMARITVEDCLDYVDNRFDLVLLATRRARQLANGVDPMIPWENDKPTVVSLREIAEGIITEDTLAEQARVMEAMAEEEVSIESEIAEELASESLQGFGDGSTE